MNYTREIITTIDDGEFDTVFSSSFHALDEQKAYPFHLFPFASYEEKKNFFRERYNQALSEKSVWRTTDENGILELYTGYIEAGFQHIELWLTAPNSEGTKSYLYTDDFINSRTVHWNSMGVEGQKFSVIPGAPIANVLNNLFENRTLIQSSGEESSLSQELWECKNNS